jgi:hypothetical protein
MPEHPDRLLSIEDCHALVSGLNIPIPSVPHCLADSRSSGLGT